MFIDETAVMLQPLVRRTWAPRGQTPTLVCGSHHGRLSVIGGLTLAPRRRRLGLYFSIHRSSVNHEIVERFLRQVQRQVRRPLVVVMDRLSAHRTAARRLEADPKGRFEVEWLPPYAPELNPIEYTWSHTKYSDMVNMAPEDLLDLEVETELSLEHTHDTPSLMRSFFRAAELDI